MKKGFTLIELIVVVAIIGIISSVVMGISGHKEKEENPSSIPEACKQYIK